MESPAESRRIVRFAEFELDLRAGELRTNGHHIILPEKPFLILGALLERPGEMVTRDELVKRLWPTGTFVDFNLSLNKAVNRLRELLHDSAEQPRFIETVPKRGYRLIVDVSSDVSAGELTTLEAGANHQPQAETPRAQISRAKIGVVTRRLLIALAGCAILTLVVALARPVVPTPRVTGVHQITHIGTIVSNQNLLVSGSRIYFMDGGGGHYQIRYVSLGDWRRLRSRRAVSDHRAP